jgi:hypothetical protein
VGDGMRLEEIGHLADLVEPFRAKADSDTALL